MCVFTHFAAGALAGAYAPHAALAPFLGLGSHVLLDVLPHYDFENMMLEILLGVISLVVLLAGGVYGFAVLAGGLMGVLPDLENLLWKKGLIGEDKKVFPGHTGRFPRHGPRAGRLNLAGQFLFSVAVLAFLIWRSA